MERIMQYMDVLPQKDVLPVPEAAGSTTADKRGGAPGGSPAARQTGSPAVSSTQVGLAAPCKGFPYSFLDNFALDQGVRFIPWIWISSFARIPPPSTHPILLTNSMTSLVPSAARPPGSVLPGSRRQHIPCADEATEATAGLPLARPCKDLEDQ